MQITTTFLFFATTLSVLATPIELEPNTVDTRDNNAVLLKYTGECTRSTNRCRYLGQNGNAVLISCPTAANKRCTNDRQRCTYESSTKEVTCE